jgi:hypothetical protein
LRPDEAFIELTSIGFRFRLDGEALKVRYKGTETPDPAKVLLLLELVKTHKSEVLAFLSKPVQPDRVLTCADCGFHHYSGPNPRQGWGHCALKARGCYGIRAACEEAKWHQK